MTESLEITAGRSEEAVLGLAGVDVVLDPSGVLVWPEEGLLVVSDLHLEKGSAFASNGVHLPPYDTRTTLRRLDAACRRFAPRTVVCLGDSFHDRHGSERLDRSDQAVLRQLMAGRSWVWILGNHDPVPPKSLGGDAMEEGRFGPLTVRHEPRPVPSVGEIAGHLHPCGRVRVRGRCLRRKCFASDGERLVMPAFGAYTGGLNVLDAAFAPLFSRAFHAWMMGDDAVYPVKAARLAPDTQAGPQ